MYKIIENHFVMALLNVRAFAKWWLEVVRNLIVVAAIQYLAAKSGNLYLGLVSKASFFLLFVYCISYPMNISVSFKIPKPILIMTSVMSGVLVLWGSIRLYGIMSDVVEEIARLQH